MAAHAAAKTSAPSPSGMPKLTPRFGGFDESAANLIGHALGHLAHGGVAHGNQPARGLDQCARHTSERAQHTLRLEWSRETLVRALGVPCGRRNRSPGVARGRSQQHHRNEFVRGSLRRPSSSFPPTASASSATTASGALSRALSTAWRAVSTKVDSRHSLCSMSASALRSPGLASTRTDSTRCKSGRRSPAVRERGGADTTGAFEALAAGAVATAAAAGWALLTRGFKPLPPLRAAGLTAGREIEKSPGPGAELVGPAGRGARDAPPDAPAAGGASPRNSGMRRINLASSSRSVALSARLSSRAASSRSIPPSPPPRVFISEHHGGRIERVQPTAHVLARPLGRRRGCSSAIAPRSSMALRGRLSMNRPCAVPSASSLLPATMGGIEG